MLPFKSRLLFRREVNMILAELLSLKVYPFTFIFTVFQASEISVLVYILRILLQVFMTD